MRTLSLTSLLMISALGLTAATASFAADEKPLAIGNSNLAAGKSCGIKTNSKGESCSCIVINSKQQLVGCVPPRHANPGPTK